ncbi:MAG: hypothetical protein JWN14_568 [Chthonomonadales bacterium]|nr:hypothetical protein [Chthonomonadales bacterium]
MAAPHREDRIGELANATEIAVLGEEILALKDYVTVSGGWAWHFMSPEGHSELKHAHDHKDADLFVAPEKVGELMPILQARGYEKTWTRFDGRQDSQDFVRYTKHVPRDGREVKVILDLFIHTVPSVLARGIHVVEPNYLLTLYGVKHSSGECFSLKIAKGLLANGENPVGHSAMGDFSPYMPQSKSGKPRISSRDLDKRQGL